MCDRCKESAERLKSAHGIEHALLIATELNVRRVVEVMQHILDPSDEDLMRFNAAIDVLHDTLVEKMEVTKVGEAVMVHGQMFLSMLVGLLSEYQSEVNGKDLTKETANTAQRVSGGPMRGQGRDQ